MQTFRLTKVKVPRKYQRYLFLIIIIRLYISTFPFFNWCQLITFPWYIYYFILYYIRRAIETLNKKRKWSKTKESHLSMLFFVELNKTNEVKFWLTIYFYFDVSMIMVVIIKKNKYLKKSHKN